VLIVVSAVLNDLAILRTAYYRAIAFMLRKHEYVLFAPCLWNGGTVRSYIRARRRSNRLSAAFCGFVRRPASADFFKMI
jgi:hypothetical protein